MAVEKIQKRIGKPASKDDKFELCVLSIQELINENENKPEIVTTNHNSISPLSTELSDGMSIKAFDGGNPNNKDKTEDAR